MGRSLSSILALIFANREAFSLSATFKRQSLFASWLLKTLGIFMLRVSGLMTRFKPSSNLWRLAVFVSFSQWEDPPSRRWVQSLATSSDCARLVTCSCSAFPSPGGVAPRSIAPWRREFFGLPAIVIFVPAPECEHVYRLPAKPLLETHNAVYEGT